MKKIALITDGWKRLIVYAWVAGIMNRIHETGEDVAVYQYNCYGNWSSDKKYNTGEYNIFNLPALSEYDGIILDCNNIVDDEKKEELIQKLRESNVPVISLMYEIDGFYYAGIDNKEPVRQLVKHLYEAHDCRKFLFAGGPKENSENQKRVAAFSEQLTKLNIPILEDTIWYGDYDYETGVSYFKNLMKKNTRLPDAIVCANDNIAAGICETAEHYGYRVPDDFLVTGFDNLDKAAYFRPQITTVDMQREKIGEMAAQMLIDIWKGIDINPYQIVKTDCIWSESCGCPNNGRVDYREYIKKSIIYGIAQQKADERLVDLEDSMSECRDFPEIFEKIAKYFGSLDCDGYYLLIDRKLYNVDYDTKFRTDGYCLTDMEVGYALENGTHLTDITSLELWEHMQRQPSGTAYMIVPIHFRENSVGVAILKNGRFLYDNPYFYDIHSIFQRMLENLFKQLQLEKANRRMKELYNRDVLTGLYNRVAYTEMIMPKYKSYCEQGIVCAMEFFDVDHFKEINDTLGHSYGDMILKTIAGILEQNKPEDGYAYRFGGDEFVVFFPNATEEKIQCFRRKVEKELARKEIEVSIGVIVTDPSDIKDLDDYLIMADEEMYRVKTARKAHRK